MIGPMRVQLLAADGTVLFVGAVDPEDHSQHITWTQEMNQPSRLRVDVTDVFAALAGKRDR